MQDITVVIHTHNEEDNIRECIESAKLLTAAINVIDMESTDNTAELAKNGGAKALSFPYSRYVEPSREFGIRSAETQWVFILDADERITPSLAEEIRQTISSTSYTHFKVTRKELFAKKIWLKHGGWWPNHQMRLIKKEALVTWPEEIHSTPVIKGETGYLKNPIIHYSKNDYGTIVEKTLVFEDIESGLLYNAGRKVTTAIFFRKFAGELYRRLFKNAGYLDGNIGIIESIYQAFSKTITYLFLYEKKKSRPL